MGPLTLTLAEQKLCALHPVDDGTLRRLAAVVFKLNRLMKEL